tara:strand:- start:628 stop:948 length:321 start_codon:yes stop_codon:yes gene_type:complete
METNRNTTNLIKDIIFYYVKYYYDKHLKDNGIQKINDDKVDGFVDTLFSTNPSKFKKYIRDSLKKNQGDDYNSIIVENILLEIFDDMEFAKNRLITEINTFQSSSN